MITLLKSALNKRSVQVSLLFDPLKVKNLLSITFNRVTNSLSNARQIASRMPLGEVTALPLLAPPTGNPNTPMPGLDSVHLKE